jgi:hypothetical protein
VKNVGKPCKREAYARIDGGRLETERRSRSPRWHNLPGNRRNTDPGTYRRSTPPRQSPTLHGRYYRTALNRLLKRINTYLMRWAQQKYKRLRPFRKALRWWKDLTARQPHLFAHWAWENEIASGFG